MPAAIHFEAIKCALRQSKEGVVLSLVIHPNDLDPAVLSAPIGQQWIVALAPYVESPSVESNHMEVEKAQLRPIEGVLTPKERYAKSSEGEKAVTRAALLCKDPQFWGFMTAADQNECVSRLCDALFIDSRSKLATSPEALTEFLALETEYLQATGKLAQDR